MQVFLSVVNRRYYDDVIAPCNACLFLVHLIIKVCIVAA